MQHPTLKNAACGLILGALFLTCSGTGLAWADSVPVSDDDLQLAGTVDLNRYNQRPQITISLNTIAGTTPLEVEATVLVNDREEDRMRCAVRFDFQNDPSNSQRMAATFPNGNPQITVRRHTYPEGEGVRHIRVFCRDFENRNGVAKADAFVVLNPCDGQGYNACGTCGELPELPCAPGDALCQAQVADVCTPVCGDDSVTGSEVCDGAVVVGESCSTMGLGRGALRCSSDCQGFLATDCTQAPSCPESYAEPPPHGLIPDSPRHVDADVEGCRKVRVAWRYNTSTHTTSSQLPGLAGFVVYRDGEAIAETTGRETCRRRQAERGFIDDTVEAGSTHTYQIAAMNNRGQTSEPIGLATVTVPAADSAECADTIPPAVPTHLRRVDPGTHCRQTQVAINGVPDVGTGVRGYRYYLDGGEQCVEVASNHVGGGLRLQYAQGLHPGSTYDVQVAAVDHAGNESPKTESLQLEVAECEKSTEYRTIIVLATYPDMPPPPMTPAEVEASVFGPENSLSSFYDENSQSTVEIKPGASGGVTDWIVLPHDRLHYCDVVQYYTPNGVGAYCDFELLRRDALEQLGNSVDFRGVDKAVFAFYGSGGANSAVIVPFGEDGLNMSTLVHETAHAWADRNHARGLTCPAGHYVPPEPGDPGLGCVLSEYGDAFDPMGSGSGHFSAHNKIEMGLLGIDALGMARQSAFYPVDQLALPSDGRKEIRVPLGDEAKDPAYSFEYRIPEGWDAALGVDGVVVRIVGPDFQHSLGTSDMTGLAEETILNPGVEPFVDPYRNIQVRVFSKNRERAILHVCRD